MPSLRRVIAYSGMDYTSVLELPTDIYLLMLKHSIMNDMRATPKGREYLEQCERLQQTEPDMAAIRQYQQKSRG